MIKKTLILALAFLGISTMGQAQNTILEARGMGVGSVVTVKGIVTHGNEFGSIRYFQDNTAGIAAYGSLVNEINQGDSVMISGTLKNYYQLLELDPLTQVVILSSGNTIPEPIILSMAQIGEQFESRLVKLTDVVFADGGGVFAGNKKYAFTKNEVTGYIYIRNDQTDIIGQPIPNGRVNITGICSQYHFSNPNGGYQLLPRTISDILITSSIYLTTTLINTNFTQTALDFTWTTNIAGTTEMFYGFSAESVNSNHITGNGGTVNHQISVTGISAGQIIWVKAFSINGMDTAFSNVTPFATISNSSGAMKAYFNSAVDINYSNGLNAVYLQQTMDDTLISYINRARYSIDLTMYNFNNEGISNVSTALIAATNRGLTVRVIGCGTTDNMGINELAGTNVNVFTGPSSSGRTGLMHNKFILFDTESSDPNDPLVWTGSTNLTDGQINLDANNVIIVQDQSLARAYKIEFDEMWGSAGNTPDPAKARFGFNKKNNTPHEFVINGKRVECYFSPTDGVNNRIINTINTANQDLSIATMLITRNEIADAIAASQAAGVAVNVITNAMGNNGTTVNTILNAALGSHYTSDVVSGGILHHKYMIVDQGGSASDPMVFTGSHNWSAAADNDNDENSLIIHDASIANIYYQNFVYRFVENNGVLYEITSPPVAVNDSVNTNIDQTVIIEPLANDIKIAPVTLSITAQSANGLAYIPFANPNVIGYEPNNGFNGIDSISYKIAYQDSPELFATAKIFIEVSGTFGTAEVSLLNRFRVFPNPVQNDNFNISINMTSIDNGTIQLFDITGKQISEQAVNLSAGENVINHNFGKLEQGTYFLRLTSSKAVWNQKVIVK